MGVLSSFQARWPFFQRAEQRSFYKMRSEPVEAAGEPGRALLAIGDVHGNLGHLEALLRLLEPRILEHREAGLAPLVVMLGAIALHRVVFGLLLIVVFSLGLASVLTGIGIAFVHAGRLFERIPHQGRLLRLAPLAGAAFITIAGVGIAYAAILQTGLLT